MARIHSLHALRPWLLKYAPQCLLSALDALVGVTDLDTPIPIRNAEGETVACAFLRYLFYTHYKIGNGINLFWEVLDFHVRALRFDACSCVPIDHLSSLDYCHSTTIT